MQRAWKFMNQCPGISKSIELKHAYWLRSGAYTLMEKAVSLLYGFGGAVVLFRSLEKAEFGTWVLFTVVVSILEVGRIGLLQNALVKYLSEHNNDEETSRINTASVVLNLMLTGVIILLLNVFAGTAAKLLHAPDLAPLLRIYSFTTLALIPFFQFNYIQQANLDFKGIFFSNLFKGSVLFGYIIFAFSFGKNIELSTLAWYQVGSAVVGSVVAWYFARPWLNYSRRVDWQWVRKLFRFGKYVLGTNLSTQIFRNSDKLLLGALPGAGAAAVALYDAAMRITNLTDIPTHSMASMLFPQTARRTSENGALKFLYEKAVGAILAFLVPVIIVVELFAEWIIHIVAGPEYAESAMLLRITILFGLFIPYAVQFGTLLDSAGRPRVNFLYTLLSLVLTAAFNYLFIIRMGVMGAALGTLLAYGASFALMQWYLHRHFGIQPLRPFMYMAGFVRSLLRFAMRLMRGEESLLKLIAKLAKSEDVSHPSQTGTGSAEPAKAESL